MKRSAQVLWFISMLFGCYTAGWAQPVIYVNQVAYDSSGSKMAVVGFDQLSDQTTEFQIVDASSLKVLYKSKLNGPFKLKEWDINKTYYQADFSRFHLNGTYKVLLTKHGKSRSSVPFKIGENALARITLPALLHYFRKQRANTSEEWKADEHVQLYRSDQTVDLRGGWCDASGDVSKYFSHLAYANFMSPQQIPLVTWSLVNTTEKVPKMLGELHLLDSIREEAIWGADYLRRSLSGDDFFYMTLFSYFSKDPKDRRVVGLRANSVTTNEYQCAFREGGGMAIAALARISRWKLNGIFTSSQYLEGAERAYTHLLKNNDKYTDDGKDNIIDDYCALMAATELWISTDRGFYRDEARKFAVRLKARQTREGYLLADDGIRPFWHASDAGLPVVALNRYLEKENEPTFRNSASEMIKKILDDQIRLSKNIENPFEYARQRFLYQGKLKDGFFIPHENETGWWWQGENARLASLATSGFLNVNSKALTKFAYNQLNWILGMNPFQRCFMYGFGQKNVPYMHSSFGHGSETGGISNGITGREKDGRGILFKEEDNGNEWRWTEQWLPHAAWFLQAVTATVKEDSIPSVARINKPRFRVLAFAENGGHHLAYSKAARVWLDKLAADSSFKIDYVQDTHLFNDSFLAKYQLLIQLDYVPYGWKPQEMAAFKKYLDQKKGGWIGFHHATLLGDFDGYKMWSWFSDFMGEIQFKNYIADFSSGEVNVEQANHPVMKGVSRKFTIEKEEWYTYNKSPRSNVAVLASVNEDSYRPGSDIKMGDHPVVWTNPKIEARNVYIFMGHGPELFKNSAYTTLFRNSIFWAAQPQ